MSIIHISIANYKSIESLELNLLNSSSTIQCFVGKNGVGKSNILNAIKYYFSNLDKNEAIPNILDRINTYTRRCKISVTFELSEFEFKVNNKYLESLFDKLNRTFLHDKNYIDSEKKIKIKKVTITMEQDKNNTLRWSHNLEIRKKIKSLFPIYHIDTRSLDLCTWDKLWDIISDLSATTVSKGQDEIIQILDDAFSKIYLLNTMKVKK